MVDDMGYGTLELSDYERRYVAMLDELRGAGEVDLVHEELGPVADIGDAQNAFGLIADQHGVVLDPALRRHFLGFEVVGCKWRAGDLVGEFSVCHLAGAMAQTGAYLETEFATEAESQVYQHMHPFDEHPVSGDGVLSALLFPAGATSPEVWYFDGTSELYRLDLDYGGYLDALLVTKGVVGWQLLFADVDRGCDEFDLVADDLREMLEVFPRIFPGHDYEPLRDRLDERV
ncbi:hypothetical protein SACE_5420 [Saccharopolyspora erythraea NRRL 2338]|uniref:Uncharacterized protein n=2 Tax=Saccharopolyspora erythraea TaxID=1836 RepID=A4FKT0_SACEN|nr:hypothetical protein SACE_5420 [Saccharopolyspora erythraea NRRL 2338]